MNPATSPDTIWVNGAVADTVSALDRGLHYGDGLFETLACIEGRPRFLSLHLERLARGCARLQLPPPDLAALGAELEQLAGEAGRCVLKLILTRGAAVARGYAVHGSEQPTRLILRYPWQPPPQDTAQVRIAGLQLAESPVTAGLKHLNRLEQVLARAECSDPAIAEALLFSRSGALISGTMSNVFLVHDGTLSTPGLELCGVAGVMRQVVLQAAAESGIGAQVRTVGRAQLDTAEEIFLTNALWGIRGVTGLEGRALRATAVTRRLQTAIAPLLAGGYFAVAGGS